MMAASAGKTIREKARDIKVCREADVVVVGGGPGGIGAALGAARNGANTVLVERYGHLGGMATGGLVTIIPNLSDVNGKRQFGGICREWIDRLEKRDASSSPKIEDLGSRDKEIVSYYMNRAFFYTQGGMVIDSALIDAEILKYTLNEMVEDAGVKTYLHSWGTEAVMENGKVKGIIFESKSGRQAILGKVVIDSTGDGDLLPSAGCEFDARIDPKLRIANLSLSYWFANVDLKKAEDFKKNQPEKLAALQEAAMKVGAHPRYIKSNLKDQDSCVWFHPRYACSSQIDVEELTRVEFEGRKHMMATYEFFKKNMPGFEHCFIVLSAPQLGTRGARRVIGEYMVTENDLNKGEIFKDTIAVFPAGPRPDQPYAYIPYRSLVPKDVDGLLVACRAFSSDQIMNTHFNLIPHCIALGEVAGTAAALSVKAGAEARKVNISALQEKLLKQGVLLPGVSAAKKVKAGV
jgi:hypothetical protein